jgi:hypothetical protein
VNRPQKKFDLVKHPDIDNDIRTLAATNKAAAEKALMMMVALLYGQEEGKRLGVRTSPGGQELDLSDCKRLYFDTDDTRVRQERNSRYRIIYREEPPARPSGLRRINLLAVGDRHHGQVYDAAGERLERTTPRQSAAPTRDEHTARMNVVAQGLPGTRRSRLNKPSQAGPATAPTTAHETTRGRPSAPER